MITCATLLERVSRVVGCLKRVRGFHREEIPRVGLACGKGVVISHHKLRERIEAANAALAIGPGDRVLWMLSMAAHFAVSIILYLYHGACTVLSESHLAAEVMETARTTKATVIYGAPLHFSLLAADPGSDHWRTFGWR